MPEKEILNREWPKLLLPSLSKKPAKTFNIQISRSITACLINWRRSQQTSKEFEGYEDEFPLNVH
jgi:hypothetical protein